MLEVPGGAGITLPTFDVLSFGDGFFDYNNDGWLDLFIANGHVYPEVDLLHTRASYRLLNSLFRNQANGKFVETSQGAGIATLPPRVGRGVAFGDFDNEAFVDVVVANTTIRRTCCTIPAIPITS